MAAETGWNMMGQRDDAAGLTVTTAGTLTSWRESAQVQIEIKIT
jgi:hypothetical protein